MTASDYSQVKVGAFDLLLIRDGGGPRDAAGFLPSAPQDELERIIRAQNFDPAALEFAIKPILIKSGDQRILIDTGLGVNMSNLPAHLRENGIAPGDISLIIITHGHGDHVGGIFDAEGNFVYPNASYVVWRSEWDYWTADDCFASSDTSHAKMVWQTLNANAGRVQLIDERDPQIVPGICAVPIPGHTVGQIAVELESEGEKFLHIADAAHHTFQLACPQWSPQFDTDKQQAAETRRAIFKRAARDGVLLSAYHFTFPGVGRVVERDGELKWEAVGE